jgi:hypothetical protein
MPLIPPADVPAIHRLAERSRAGFQSGLEQRRAVHEPLQLLRDAVHVDRERRAAVADEREPQLLPALLLRCVDAVGGHADRDRAILTFPASSCELADGGQATKWVPWFASLTRTR